MVKRKNKGPTPAEKVTDSKNPRGAVFQDEFREDLRYWARNDKTTFNKIFDLIEAILSDSFQGHGKPEPLKYDFEGCWSRRITQEHRLVYLVTDTEINFLQARYHY